MDSITNSPLAFFLVLLEQQHDGRIHVHGRDAGIRLGVAMRRHLDIDLAFGPVELRPGKPVNLATPQAHGEREQEYLELLQVFGCKLALRLAGELFRVNGGRVAVIHAPADFDAFKMAGETAWPD